LSESKFSWQLVTDTAEWDRLVGQSPQGTLFSERIYLDLAEAAYEIYLIRQGKQTKAGVCIIRSPDGSGCCLDDLVIHNGIMFLPDETKKPVRQRFERFELTEFVIAELNRSCGHVELALAPQFEDLRPFLWHNFHDSEARNRFLVDLRYTTYLDISGLAAADDDETSAPFRTMDTLRQRHVRDAGKKGGSVRISGDGAALVDYYHALMIRQGAPAEQEKLTRMRNLVDGLEEAGRGAIYEVLNADGIIVYVVVYGWDSKRAYYLFGAGHPEISESWQGTLAHWGAFKDMAKRVGIREVDLEGVNSPKRGWFKLGFGGELRPYYQVTKAN
jgi:hypothetical protein